MTVYYIIDTYDNQIIDTVNTFERAVYLAHANAQLFESDIEVHLTMDNFSECVYIALHE